MIALNDLAITTTNFTNKSYGINYTINHECVTYNGGHCHQYKINFDKYGNKSLGPMDKREDGYVYSFEAISSFITASLKAHRNLTIIAPNKITNGTVTQGEEIQDPNLSTDHSDFTSDDAYISPTVTSLKESGSLNITPIINSLIPASEDSGLFTKSPNPNAPLFETRATFIDQSQFFGSDYFFRLMGLPTPAETRAIGDNFFIQKMIEQQLNQIFKATNFPNYSASSSSPSGSSFSYSDDIQTLMQNAAEMKSELQLSPGITLSAESVAALTKDIVWMEAVNIRDPKTGAVSTVIVPKVYLAKSTINKLNNRDGEIISGNNVTISGNSASTTLTNSGSIIAANNLLISDISTLNNQGRSNFNRNSLLQAGNDLNITLSSNLLNLGTIKTTGANSNLTLTSLNGNITNTNFSNISSGGNLTLNSLNGTLLNKSTIEAKNNLTLNAFNIKNISTVETDDNNLLASNPEGLCNKILCLS